MIILHVPILDCSQSIKQFQEPFSDLPIPKLNLHTPVRNAFNWLINQSLSRDKV